MKLYRNKAIGAASATALVALLAGVSTGSAQPDAAKPARADKQVVNVSLQRGGIGYTPSHLMTGSTTLVVHNSRPCSGHVRHRPPQRRHGEPAQLHRHALHPSRGDRRPHAALLQHTAAVSANRGLSPPGLPLLVSTR